MISSGIAQYEVRGGLDLNGDVDLTDNTPATALIGTTTGRNPPADSGGALLIPRRAAPAGRAAYTPAMTHAAVPASDEAALLTEYLSAGDADELIPRLARDPGAIGRFESAVRRRETTHQLIVGDARTASALEPDSVHLVVTSPPC